MIIDSYSESNYAGWESTLNNTYKKVGQSFDSNSIASLDSCKFYLRKYGSPTGNAYAKLYNHFGTYGLSSLPSDPTAPIATSGALDVSTLATSLQLITFNFTGINKAQLKDDYYVLLLEYESGTSSNNIAVGIDVSSPTHSGCFILYNGTSQEWSTDGDTATIFYVEGTLNPKIQGISTIQKIGSMTL